MLTWLAGDPLEWARVGDPLHQLQVRALIDFARVWVLVPVSHGQDWRKKIVGDDCVVDNFVSWKKR
jgi:hypothetical protein